MEFYVIILNAVFVAIAAAPFSRDKSSGEFGEYGDYFEGDMLLTKAQYKAIEKAKMSDGDKEENKAKNGLIDVSKRWPNKTVVYDIQEDDGFDIEQITMFEEALQDITDKSCIKFRKRESDDEYAVVVQGKTIGCFSSVGYLGDRSVNESEPNQVINLADNCFRHGTIVHEMLHTLGFYHMQSTYDRDDYVTIFWENIKDGHTHNFIKYTTDTVTDFGETYDYGSLMHYSATAFSKNGNNTITPKKEGVKIGQRKGLSKIDIIKLNRMYDCPNEATSTEKESVMD